MIKKLIILFIYAFSTNYSFAQYTEYAIVLGSGFFNFQRNPDQVGTSLIALQGGSFPETTQSPYGENAGLSYSAALQVQSVIEGDIIFGLQLAYERLQSQQAVNDFGGNLTNNFQLNTGESVLNNQFINVFPYLGKRITTKDEAIDIDLFLGTEFAFFIESKELVEASTITGQNISFETLRNEPVFDFRVRFGVNIYYKFIGLTAGYSYGFVNYNAPSFREPTVPIAESRMLRLGLLYRINNPRK